jgi:uncharacterized membrane protein required for colicin V production
MNAGLIIDIVLSLFFLFGFIIGIRRGFIRGITKIVKIFGSLFIGFKYARTLADSLIYAWIEPPITNSLTEYLTEKCAHLTASNATSELPTFLKLAASLFDVNISEVAEESAGEVIGALSASLTHPVAMLISVVISFVVLFIVSYLLFGLILGLINALFSIGPFNLVNKLIGSLFGLLMAALLAWGAVAVFGLLEGTGMFANAEWYIHFEGGPIFRFFDTYGPLDLLFGF